MRMETVMVSRNVQETSKKRTEIDTDLFIHLIKSLEDIKVGRVRKVK